MVRLSVSRKFILFALTAGIALTGCVEPHNSPGPGDEVGNGVVDGDGDGDADGNGDGKDNVLEPDEDDPLVFDNSWGAAYGPRGGIYTQLWSAGEFFFAVEQGLQSRAYLWRSSGGADWSKVALPDDVYPQEFRELVALDGALYLIGFELLRSVDNGLSWEAHQWDGITPAQIVVAREFDEALYVVVEQGLASGSLYRIGNGEVVLVDDEVPAPAVDLIVSEERLLVSRGHYGGELMVKESTDAQWSRAGAPTPNVFDALRLHEHRGAYYATSKDGVWRSQDGQTFARLTTTSASQAAIVGDELFFGLLEPWNYVAVLDIADPTSDDTTLAYLGAFDRATGFVMASNGETLLGAMHHGGLVKMERHEGVWHQVSPTGRALSRTARAAGYDWVLTTEGTLFRSEDGLDWQPQPTAEHLIADMLPGAGGLFLVTKNGEALWLRSLPGGFSLGDAVALASGKISALGSYDDVIVAGFSPVQIFGRGGSSLIGGGLFLATNQAAHWTDWNKIDAQLPDPRNSQRHTPAIYGLHATADFLSALSDEGVYRSTDAGLSWTRSDVDVDLALPLFSARLAAFAETEDALFLALAAGEEFVLYRSDDQGQSFSEVAHSLPATVRPMSLHAKGNALFLGTAEDGVFASVNGGLTWPKAGQDFEGGMVFSFESGDGVVRAVTSTGIVELAVQ